MKRTWKNFLLIPLLLAVAIAPVRGADDTNDTAATAVATTPAIEVPSAPSDSSVYGIGASLKVDDNGHIKILSLQPGKPAAKTKKIKAGDRLIAIADGTNEPVDVAGMELNEVAEKIRGGKGTEVRLTLLPGDRVDAKQIVVPVTRGDFDMTVENASHPRPAKRSSDNSVQISPSHIHLGSGGGNDVDIDVPKFEDNPHFLGNVSFLAAAIAIVGTVVPFLTLFLIVVIFFTARQKRTKELHATLRAMIEKGVPIPPELIVPPDRIRRRVASDLRTGLVILAIGAGVMVMTARVGIILVLVGVAFLITWIIEKKNSDNK